MPDTCAVQLETALEQEAQISAGGDKVFTRLYIDRARMDAAAADRRRSEGKPLGPMDGRLVSIKDLFDVAGEPTTAGSAGLDDQPNASADAAIVERLRAAGAIIVGKTHMTELAFSAVGINRRDGNPGNPADRTRLPGGSSSGAAISVMAGIVEIGIGSDTGGSIRIPSALCGAVGFKPTSGRLPTTGAFSLSNTLDVVGPIARSVADCALTDAVLSGGDQRPLAVANLTALKLTIPRGRLFADIEPVVADRFEAAVDHLRSAGATITEGTIEDELDAISLIDAIGFFPAIEVAVTLRQLGLGALDAIDPRVRVRIEGGAKTSGSGYVHMGRLRAALVRRLAQRQAAGEIFLMPTVPITAPKIEDALSDDGFQRINGLLLRNTRVANLFDCPAISLPLPGAGLPVGLSLIGGHAQDRALLAAAAAIEPALAV